MGKSSNIGGQAVIEGVMMRSGDQYAVAVRKPDQEIEVKVEDYKSFIKHKKLTTIPIIRGAFNFIDSMVVGMKTLTYSASFYEDEEEVKEKEKPKSEKQEKVIMGFTVAFSLLISIGMFMILPYFIASFLRRFTDSYAIIAIAEAVIRMVIFIGYIVLISFMKDIKRLFRYHGAEHKCINCIETGHPLTVENVMKSSKQHKRCGTSFLLIVVFITAILFMFIKVDSPVLRVVIRLLLIPVIAGISYEFIRLAGRSDNKLVNILSKPGMWMQNLTTKEPDERMVEVAIASVEAVFDWEKYLADNKG
ncbi:MAG TPA: DUF1385 domain-containing protein [Candidatus Merdenecus merdavium]|nr:DUF1385 domain-containing protein [Candidatus Merdenecus merdavium]